MKFAVLFAPLMVTDWLAGVMMYPVLLGDTVYDPFANPLKVYAPEEFAVAVAVEEPVSLTVAPDPPAPLMTPVMVKVCTAELKFAVLLPPLTVTAWLAGVKT